MPQFSVEELKQWVKLKMDETGATSARWRQSKNPDLTRLSEDLYQRSIAYRDVYNKLDNQIVG